MSTALNGYSSANTSTKQAQDIRNLIQSGVKYAKTAVTEEEKRNANINPESTYLKQTTLALFGAETTRSKRTFLPQMMLLDNMQSGKGYGKGSTKKNLTVSNLLQRNSKVGYSVKSAKTFNDSSGYAMIKPDQNGHSYGGKAFVGGKAPMAGADTFALGKKDDYTATNIVHAKESRFINSFINENIFLSVRSNLTD